MRVLVTGGYGFIGSFVADLFASEGHDVCIIDNLSHGYAQQVKQRHKFYEMNVEDRACEKIFQLHNFDAVVHLASQSDGSESVNTNINSQNDLLGLTHMLHLSEKYGVKVVVFVSSANVYDQNEPMPLTELSKCNPSTLRGFHEWIGELYCMKWMERTAMSTVCLRLSEVYGPRMLGTAEKGSGADFIEQLMVGENIVIHGDGESKINLLYVEDAAEAIYLSIIHHLNGIYNLSSPIETSQHDIHEHIATLGASNNFIHDASEERMANGLLMSGEKLAKAINWTPLYSLREGLAKTFDHYKSQHQPIQRKRRQDKEHPRIYRLMKTCLSLLSHVCLFMMMIALKIQLIDTLYMVDFQLIYIIIAAFIFGRYESMLAIGLGSSWFVYDSITNGRELISLFADHNTLVHLGLYMFTGLVLAYVLGRKNNKMSEIQKDAMEVKDQHTTLLASYDNVVAIKNELQNQVLYANESFGTVYDMMKDLDFVELAKTYTTAIKVCEKIMKTKKVALYMLNSSQEELQLVSRSEQLVVQSSFILAQYRDLCDMKETKAMYVNKKLEPHLPAIAAPIIIDGTVEGALCLFDDQFENVTLFNRNLLSIATNLIATALKSAYQHQDAIGQDKQGISISIYNKEEAYA